MVEEKKQIVSFSESKGIKSMGSSASNQDSITLKQLPKILPNDKVEKVQDAKQKHSTPSYFRLTLFLRIRKRAHEYNPSGGVNPGNV